MHYDADSQMHFVPPFTLFWILTVDVPFAWDMIPKKVFLRLIGF